MDFTSINLNFIIRELNSYGDVLRYSENPGLSALITCLGIASETGVRELDRLTAFFCFDENPPTQPWQSEIFMDRGKLGLRITRQDGKLLHIRHPDFAKLMHPQSLAPDGSLNSIVIFPEDVASLFRTQGLELVIVKKWAFNSFADDPNKRVDYLTVNIREVEDFTLLNQAKMILNNQIAFIGTHDLVDHLLDYNSEGLEVVKPLAKKIINTISNLNPKTIQTNEFLLIAYCISVILDDLVQPKWYGAVNHIKTTAYLLEVISSRKFLAKLQPRAREMRIPVELDPLFKALRHRETVNFTSIIYLVDSYIDKVFN